MNKQDENACFEQWSKERREKILRLGRSPTEVFEGGYRYTMGNNGEITDQASRSADKKQVDVYYFEDDPPSIHKRRL